MEKIKKYWFQILLTIAVLFTLLSCDIQKKAIKDKQDRTVTELSQKTFTRQGDTVTYEVPNIKFKDTTIYTVNRQGTTLRTVYNEQGNLSQIECISSLIEVTERLERTLEEQIKSKDKEKEENFDSSVILYGFIGLGIILFIFLYFVNKNTVIVKKLAEKL